MLAFSSAQLNVEPGPFRLIVDLRAWHLPQTAKAFSERGALAGLWITFGNHGNSGGEISPGLAVSRRHVAALLFVPQIWEERAFYELLPLWRAWLNSQEFPPCNVVQAIMGYGTEPFDRAEKIGALKVMDCPNTHPATYYGIWQRECDRWCPGEKIPIPQWMFARMKRELERADLVIVNRTLPRKL